MPDKTEAVEKALANRIADAGIRGGQAYRPSADEIVSPQGVQRVIEYVHIAWNSQRARNLRVRYDEPSERYIIGGSAPQALRPQRTDALTAQLIRRR